jgi:two-component system, OmpR family, response regulator
MKTETIIQDYYGTSFFLEAHSDKKLTVFIVDDNKIYLNLLKNVIKGSNITVHTFDIGEDCLKCLDLKPDLIILDYHLDGVNPGVMKGDKIAELIEEKLPDTEIVMISSDQKFKLLVDLKLTRGKNVVYKDKTALKTLKEKSKSAWNDKLVNLGFKDSMLKTVWFALIATGVFAILFILYKMYYV